MGNVSRKEESDIIGAGDAIHIAQIGPFPRTPDPELNFNTNNTALFFNRGGRPDTEGPPEQPIRYASELFGGRRRGGRARSNAVSNSYISTGGIRLTVAFNQSLQTLNST